MKGLILKDFYTALSYARMLLLYVLFFGGVGLYTGNISFICTMVVVIAMTITLSSFTYDEFYHWERYAASAPVTRRQIVAAKYLFLFLLSGIFVLGATLFALVNSLLHPDVSILEGVISTLAVCLVSVTFLSLSIPMIYKFGSQKGRTFIMMFFGLAFVAALLVFNFSGAAPKEISLVPVLAAGVGVCLLLILGSYLLAVRIYAQKELK